MPTLFSARSTDFNPPVGPSDGNNQNPWWSNQDEDSDFYVDSEDEAEPIRFMSA